MLKGNLELIVVQIIFRNIPCVIVLESQRYTVTVDLGQRCNMQHLSLKCFIFTVSLGISALIQIAISITYVINLMSCERFIASEITMQM